MRIPIIAFAVGGSSLVISERFGAAIDSVKLRADDLISAAHDRFDALESGLYGNVLTATSDDEIILDIPGGQHAFELFGNTFEEPHHPPGKKPPHKRPPHKKPDHDNPHDQRDKTLYELIADSEYFSTLHDIIKGDEHTVAELNKTSANLTFFAPTNKALEKYQAHAPSVEYLRKILLYHLLPEVYPAGRVLKSKTLETLYHEEELDQNQRLAVDIGLRGLTLNYYARIIYINVFTSNGVLHAIDDLLVPPPKIYDIAEILPASFSTFINAAWKTGLVETLNETKHSTIFAPSNIAFASLGARINAFLFSTRGQPVLTKLIKYHIVPDVLFYSDAVYDKESSLGLVQHYEFDNLLEEKINVDVSEWGRFKTIVFNGRSLRVSDIPARNGVLSKLNNGIILPYKRSMSATSVQDMTVEQFASLFDDDEGESAAPMARIHVVETERIASPPSLGQHRSPCRSRKPTKIVSGRRIGSQAVTKEQMQDQMLLALLSDDSLDEEVMFTVLE